MILLAASKEFYFPRSKRLKVMKENKMKMKKKNRKWVLLSPEILEYFKHVKTFFLFYFIFFIEFNIEGIYLEPFIIH